MEGSINDLQEREEHEGGGLNEDDLIVLWNQLTKHHSLLSQQEILRRQKSRMQWIREGDKNTRFFHQAIIVKRYKNHI